MRGRQTTGETLDTLRRVAKRIGMRYEGLHASAWEYPAFEGGGVGHTVIQPVIESFIAGDAWPELMEEGVVYFLLFSCKNFDHFFADIMDMIQIGDLKIVDYFVAMLDATRDPKELKTWHTS